MSKIKRKTVSYKAAMEMFKDKEKEKERLSKSLLPELPDISPIIDTYSVPATSIEESGITRIKNMIPPSSYLTEPSFSTTYTTPPYTMPASAGIYPPEPYPPLSPGNPPPRMNLDEEIKELVQRRKITPMQMLDELSHRWSPSVILRTMQEMGVEVMIDFPPIRLEE